MTTNDGDDNTREDNAYDDHGDVTTVSLPLPCTISIPHHHHHYNHQRHLHHHEPSSSSTSHQYHHHTVH
jgi:hypothetical protein